MSNSKEVELLVRRHMGFYNELEAIDTQLRFPLNMDQRREISPWGATGPDEDAGLCIWRKLDRGDISEDQAVAEMRVLMDAHYHRT